MQNLSQTKIVATIGPSSWDTNTLSEMIKNGMQMARINASFADASEIERVATQIRKLSPRVALLLDTMGHKIRTAGYEDDITLKENDEILLIADDGSKVASKTIAITYPDLEKYLKGGERILLDDGNIVLEVKTVLGKEIVCTVIDGGVLKKRKTVNIPNVHLEFPGLSEKDTQDIKTATALNFDYISASFVRDMNDILLIRDVMGATDTKLIAKIENMEGVENFDRILPLVDGIMVARGDLGVELPLEKVPILQKQFIKKCRSMGKLSIVATQMLESMRENPRPTRAEVSDVANAVLDGTDALMLSAETSTGKYPVESVIRMREIALEVEKTQELEKIEGYTRASIETDTLCKYMVDLVAELKIKAIVTLSQTGKTIESLSRHRLGVWIYNINSNPQIIRQYNVRRAVSGMYMKDIRNDRDEIISGAVQVVYAQGSLELSDKIAIITGSSITNKATNSIVEIAAVKDILSK